MKKLCLIILVLSLSGCVSLEVSKSPSKVNKPMEEEHAVAKIDYVFIGMTREEVAKVLGNSLTIGYVRDQGDDQALKEITLDSPYKVDAFNGKTGSYEVLYYYTYVRNADNIIAEDEMTPLVFEKNKLIGKGWDFLFRLKDNQ